MVRVTLLVCLLLLTGCPWSGPSALDAAAQDATESADESSDLVEELAPVCPPPPPFGLNLGDRIASLEFLDGAGEPVNIHDFCGKPLTLVYHFYGW